MYSLRACPSDRVQQCILRVSVYSLATAAGAWEDLRNMIEARYWQRMGDEGEEYRRLQAIVEPLGCVHWGPKEPLLKSWRS